MKLVDPIQELAKFPAASVEDLRSQRFRVEVDQFFDPCLSVLQLFFKAKKFSHGQVGPRDGLQQKFLPSLNSFCNSEFTLLG